MSDNDSVSQWLAQLDESAPSIAQQKLWERYFEKLVHLVRPRLPAKLRRAFDEEDVALSALQSLFSAVEKKRLPQLSDRQDLWKVLVVITVRKAQEHLRYHQRQKRGGGLVRGESALVGPVSDSQIAGMDAILDHEPGPEFAVQMTEECDRLMALLGSDELQAIATLKMQGYKIDEIAAELKCTKRMIERRLTIIRKKWESQAFPQQDG